jgi:glycosyltransferase involved in cell wall biosynthesis
LRGETGWLFPPGDAAGLAAALDLALKLDADRRVELARIATENVRARFTRAGMCAATLEVYEEVIAARSPRAAPRAATAR